MALADRDYSPYQRQLIKNYYANKGKIELQRLSEMVSNLYLETNARKKDVAWKQIEKMLLDLKVNDLDVQYIVKKRDLSELAATISKLW